MRSMVTDKRLATGIHLPTTVRSRLPGYREGFVQGLGAASFMAVTPKVALPLKGSWLRDREAVASDVRVVLSRKS